MNSISFQQNNAQLGAKGNVIWITPDAPLSMFSGLESLENTLPKEAMSNGTFR
jgi:hypothetical protein